MRLLLIRHAVTAETGVRLTGRLPGVPLSPAGAKMAERAAAAVSDLGVDALYTSPILRCKQTAARFGDVWGLDPIVEKAFTEADFGSWSGRKLKDLVRLKAWQGLHKAPSRFRFPDGETLGEVRDRAVTAIEGLADRHKKDTVAIVSHNDVIRCVATHYLGMPLDLIQRLDIAPASLSVIELPEGGAARVPVLNSFESRVRR